MAHHTKNLGFLLIGFSVILFFILAIVKVNVDKQSAFLCEKFHEYKLDMNECPIHKSNSLWTNVSWMLTSAFGIVFLIFGVGGYMSFFYKPFAREDKRHFKDVDLSKLEEEEKKIYEFIKNKGGSAYQSDLIKETGFTKVKTTRILDRLETKDILERKRRGMTNIIVLK